jgi:uncharacterized DUF497 family protein
MDPQLNCHPVGVNHPSRAAVGRRLTLVITIRGTLIRVFAARDMSRRERRLYERT